MNPTLFVNARLINEGQCIEADLRIAHGRITQIGPQLTAKPQETVIDAGGSFVLPGMIDDQVHFREPGLTDKADIATESAAAIAGGITSYLDMPNTVPPTLDQDALAAKYQRAQGRSWGNFGFYLGASLTNLAAIRSIDPKLTPGVKIFMGSSTGDMLVDRPEILEQIFAQAPTLVITHCEDSPMIAAQAAQLTAQHGELTIQMHPQIRSRQACLQSSSLAISLAQRYGTRLHILHLSTAEELALLTPGPLLDTQGRCKQITAETCVHFLAFTQEDYGRLGNLIKCNPAIKTQDDRQALLSAVANDTIDVLATDHAPHTLAEKSQPYRLAPAGIPLVQHALVALLEHVHDGALGLEQLVQKCAHAPAQLFDIADRGFLREGYWADLVLIRYLPWTVERTSLLAKCGWSPFEGHTFRSQVAGTWVNGQHCWDGRACCGQPSGQRLQFSR